MRISALGIGTELTTGQILNKNGQWISQRFREWGVPTSMHLVVPDEDELILEALQFCAEHSDLVFVTGGLGPTSDDKTRELVSRWANKALVWHEASWKHIQDRLLPRGMAVKEIQKQQCYFPEGAEILTNRMGTANAFCLSHLGKEIFVLPGPPRELEAIWQDHLADRLSEKTKGVDALITHSWDTIGLGESDVADRVEAALKGCSFEKGYRVHMPYVECKLTYPKSRSFEGEAWVRKVEAAISDITVFRNGEQPPARLAELLAQFDRVLICDEIPGSFLMTRLFPEAKKLLAAKKVNFLTALPPDLDSWPVILHLLDEGGGIGNAHLYRNGLVTSQVLKSPYASSLMKDREQQYFAEMAMHFWIRQLES